MGKGEPLSEEKRYRIIFLSDSGASIKDIAKELDCHRNSVSNILKLHKTSGGVSCKERVGRREKLSRRDKRYIALISLRDRRKTAPQIREEFVLNSGRNFSVTTIKKH